MVHSSIFKDVFFLCALYVNQDFQVMFVPSRIPSANLLGIFVQWDSICSMESHSQEFSLSFTCKPMLLMSSVL